MLAGEQPIAIYDEPVSDLDADMKNSVLCEIKEECDLKDTTLIVVSHDIGDLVRLCVDKVGIFRQQTLKHFGDRKEMLDLYQSMLLEKTT